MGKKLISVVSAIFLIMLSGCYPEGAEYVEELDVVYTNYDPDFDFSQQNTFAIPDSIVLINEQNFVSIDGDNIPDIVDPVYASVILSQIRENMTAMGWTEVDREADPKVILLVTATRTTTLHYNYDYRYWDWWYPGSYFGGFRGWGWYYPGYSPGYYTGYRTGTLMIQMTNPADIGVNNNVPVVWLSVINGLLEGSTNNINNRLRQSIDQAFHQSPYLNL